MSHTHWDQPENIVLSGIERKQPILDQNIKKEFADLLNWMRFIDVIQYLPNDILTKVDRTSMSESLEVRVPILDHRIAEFAWRLPREYLLRDGQGKWILRQVLYKYVPKNLIERPKMGFGVPIGKWLKNELREWAEALLDYKTMKRQGFLNADLVQKKWLEHQFFSKR